MTARNWDFARFADSAVSASRRRASWLAMRRSAIEAPNSRHVAATKDHERLKQHESCVQLRPDERAVAERRRDHSRYRDAKHGSRGAALAEADRRPEQDGDEQVHLTKRRHAASERVAAR